MYGQRFAKNITLIILRLTRGQNSLTDGWGGGGGQRDSVPRGTIAPPINM